MFRRKTTRARGRLIKMTRRKATRLRWAMFIDRIRRALKRARVVKPHQISRDVVSMDSETQQHGRSGPNELLQADAR
jgi:hypothetical protein